MKLFLVFSFILLVGQSAFGYDWMKNLVGTFQTKHECGFGYWNGPTIKEFDINWNMKSDPGKNELNGTLNFGQEPFNYQIKIQKDEKGKFLLFIKNPFMKDVLVSVLNDTKNDSSLLFIDDKQFPHSHSLYFFWNSYDKKRISFYFTGVAQIIDDKFVVLKCEGIELKRK